MSFVRLIRLSFCYFWKANFAVACGVAVGTAVLTGALLVGDSMRGSLRDLALAGLGGIDEALVADHFFRQDLAGETSGGRPIAPVILQIGSIAAADREPAARVDQVNVIGCDARFLDLGNADVPAGNRGTENAREKTSAPIAREAIFGEDGIVVGESLARLLAVKQGDFVIVSLPKPGAIPSESALGRKRASVDTMRLKVASIAGAGLLARFSLRPNQRAPLNAFVSLQALQEQLQEPARVNAVFRAQSKQTVPWQPQLADYGIRIEDVPQADTSDSKSSSSNLKSQISNPQTVANDKPHYIDITTDRLVFSPKTEKAIVQQLDSLRLDVQPALTYLANAITLGDREVPYSTITAIDFQDAPPLGPWLSADGKPVPKLDDNQIALNTDTAKRLNAKLGDELAVTYFEPESTTGVLKENTAKLKLAAIVKLEGAAADRRLTPNVRGLTDKETIEDWDLPFQIKPGRIKPADDRYWKKYGPTPKAFVSLATGRRLWASRFGQTTSLRVRPAPGMTAIALAKQIKLDPEEQGFVFRPIKQQALAAAAGTTPFGVLFLSFSFFVIVAAVMLVVLLFRLGIEQRSRQLGLLVALGFRRRQARRLMLGEGLLVAAAGSALGVPAGVGYAALMLLGLRTWWLPAIGTPFLTLHAAWASLAIGFASGLLLAFAAIWLSVWRIGRMSPRTLMAGGTGGQYKVPSTRHPARRFNFHFAFFNLQVAILFLAVAPPLALLVISMSQDAKVGAFFTAGFWALAMLLVFAYRQLRRGATGAAVAVGGGNLLRMAARNAARNPGRSALAIGLTAAACFLIAAVSVFRIDPAQEDGDRHGPSGGFALIGTSALPIYYDLNTPAGRKELDASPADEATLAACRFYAFRVKSGDEASCLNLYQPRQPRMLGAGDDFIAYNGFSWAEVPVPRGRNPWEDLHAKTCGGATFVVLDQTTALYGLGHAVGIGDGDGFEVVDARDHKLDLQPCGLLQDSIFQGDLLVSEDNLRHYDPDVVGYRYFLIAAPAEKVADVQQALQRMLGDYGFRTETTADRLSALAAVQNTYLATFQSLGGLGLLLGTIGLAVVQWRNVLERRGEFALLRAAGYRARTLGCLIVLENLFLLVAGLSVGIIAALVAVLPQLVTRAGTVPWAILGSIFAAVLTTGLLVSLVAMRGIVRTPILAALREER